MPRYFFDFHDDGVTYDTDGVNLADDDAASRDGARALSAIAAEQIAAGNRPNQFSVTVHGIGGRPVYAATLTFREKRF